MTHAWLLLIPLVVLVSGCAHRPMPRATPKELRSAMLRWDSGGGPATFDAVFGRAPDGSGELRVFRRGSATPVLEIRANGHGEAYAFGPALRRAWRGEAAQAPPDIAVLLGALSLFVHERKLPEGTEEIHSAALHVIFTKNGSLQSASVRSVDAPVVVAVAFPGPAQTDRATNFSRQGLER